MMATYDSQVSGVNDECALLIASKQDFKEERSANDILKSLAEDGLVEEEDCFESRTPKASLMNFLWSSVRSIVSGRRNDDFEHDWTLDSGIIYRPASSNGRGNFMDYSLNNSKQRLRALFGSNWSSGSRSSGGRKNKSHEAKLTKDELNHRRFYSNNNNNNHQHHPYLKNGNNCRMLLTSVLSLTFLAATILVLVKLMNLLQETQHLRGQMFSRKLATTTNNFTLHEVSKSNKTGFVGGEGLLTDYEVYNAAKLDAGRWIVASQKCRIPYIDPWHESIRDYTKLKPEFNCTEILITKKAIGQPDAALTFVQDNKLYFTDRALSLNAMKDCCYKQVTRSEDNDYDLVYAESCNPINENGLKSPGDLIQVECSKFNYTNVHAFVVHEPEEEGANRRVAAKKLDTKQYYNVVLVGVDTISRLNGLRQLNKTLSLLYSEYNALEFMGYNKVGENTFPNLIPLLTGLRPEQLTETQCWLASNYSDESERGDDFLDNCKYLWNFYQDIGYRTYFSEDWPAASTFNYLKEGFKRQPTTFYGRPFTIARDKLLLPPIQMGCTSPCLWDKSIVELDLDNLRKFISEYEEAPHFAFHWINCPQHDDLNGASRIDSLLENFFKELRDSSMVDRTFVIFFSDHGYRWNNFVSTRVGHYESSLPLLTIAPPKHFIQNHPDLYENLKLHTSTLLTPFDMFKTLIDIRNLGIKRNLKRTFKGKHKDKIRYSNQPVKPNPTSSTSSPVAKIDELGYTMGPTARTTIQQLHVPDGLTYKQEFKILSLLSKHNSSELDRSCIEAGIPDNYCVCQEFSSLSSLKNDVFGAAYYLVYVHLYSIIKDHLKLCHNLDLEKIHKAEFFDFKRTKLANNKLLKRRDSDDSMIESTKTTERPLVKGLSTTTAQPTTIETEDGGSRSGYHLPNREYNIRLSTKPGGALFQEVVRFDGDDLELCMSSVEKVKQLMEDSSKAHNIKHSVMMALNKVCEFSIHSDSISRLNLYRDQSKCVKNNIEVKKVCYCNDLLNKSNS